MTQFVATLFIVCLFITTILAAHHVPPPERVCSGHGIVYSDSDFQHCECFDCFHGDHCQHNTTDTCTITATGGNPLLFSEYWENKHREGETVSAPWYRTAYQLQSDLFLPSPFQGPGINKYLQKAILDIHKLTNNVETKGASIVIGHGCTQLIAASCYAISKKLGKPVKAFAQIPFFDSYRKWASFNPAISSWNTSLHQQQFQSEILEYVTYPNNPDGKLRQPFYNASNLVYDMVYYWPSLTNITTKLNEDIMMFSMSKLSGHAGSRLGWAIVKDVEVAEEMRNFVGLVNIVPSIDAQYRALRILQTIVRENGTFFDHIKAAMHYRWNRLLPLFENQSRFKQTSVHYGFYMWIQCSSNENCYQIFKKAGINGEPGSNFGDSDDFVRVELVMRSSTFEILVERMQKLLQPSQSVISN